MEDEIKMLEARIADQRAALYIANETLRALAYWFDADEELLETMPPLERADNERLLKLIRDTRKEMRRLTVKEMGNA
jgi:hypothetical protein